MRSCFALDLGSYFECFLGCTQNINMHDASSSIGIARMKEKERGARERRGKTSPEESNAQCKRTSPREVLFSVEGAILKSCSLFLSFCICFTRVFFRNTHFVREWSQRHLKNSKKGQRNHLKNDSRTTPGTLWGQLGAHRWILDPTWGSNAD